MSEVVITDSSLLNLKVGSTTYAFTSSGLILPAGSASTPTFDFLTSDGFYRPSSNVVGVAVNGSRVGQYNDSLQLFVNGSTSNPALRFADTTYGFYFPNSGNNLGVLVNGTDVSQCSSSGLDLIHDGTNTNVSNIDQSNCGISLRSTGIGFTTNGSAQQDDLAMTATGLNVTSLQTGDGNLSCQGDSTTGLRIDSTNGNVTVRISGVDKYQFNSAGFASLGSETFTIAGALNFMYDYTDNSSQTVTWLTPTLANDAYYYSGTVSGIMNSGTCRIFIKNTLTINSAGSIRNNGLGAANGTPGAPPTGLVLGTGYQGASGVANAVGNTGNFTANVNLGGGGGAGGASSAGKAGGAATTASISAANGGTQVLYNLTCAMQCRNWTLSTNLQGGIGGSSGGSSSASDTSGAGGAGGSIVFIMARNLVIQSGGTIQANGGGGGNGGGGAGGGGGGGGGVVVIISATDPATYSSAVQVNGGAGGTGGTGAVAGSTGGAGRTFLIQHGF